MTETLDPSGQGLDSFLTWAGRTGEINANTAAALRGTCRSILAVDAAASEADVTAIDVEALLGRWENLNRTKYSSGSLATYRSRFRQSVAMYKAWLVKDPTWKTAGKSSSSKGTRGAGTPGRSRKGSSAQPAPRPDQPRQQTPVSPAGTDAAGVRLVAYEMPLRPDLLVRLTLPLDLSTADADRLSAFVRSLAFDGRAGTLTDLPAADLG